MVPTERGGRLLVVAATAMLVAWTVASAAAAIATERRTVVTIAFDDGTADQYQMLPILAAHRLHATFFVSSGLVGTSGRMTWAQLQELHAAGQEIGGHGLTHRNLTRLSLAAARREVCDDRVALAEHGLAPVSFAYPFAFVDAAAARVVAECGYNSGRAVGGVKEGKALAEALPPLDPFTVRSRPALKQGRSLATIQSYITAAERGGGGWVPLVFHRICDRGCGEYATGRETLAQLLDWLPPRAAQGTVVETVGEVIDGPLQPARSASSLPTLENR